MRWRRRKRSVPIDQETPEQTLERLNREAKERDKTFSLEGLGVTFHAAPGKVWVLPPESTITANTLTAGSITADYIQYDQALKAIDHYNQDMERHHYDG